MVVVVVVEMKLFFFFVVRVVCCCLASYNSFFDNRHNESAEHVSAFLWASKVEIKQEQNVFLE